MDTNTNPQGAAAEPGTEPAPQTQQTEPQGGSTYTPPATQADLDRIVENRLQRERAKYADYEQYKADSAKLGTVVAERDELKNQLDTANKELGTLRGEKQVREWAQEVSQETGVPADVIRGNTKEEMLAHAQSLEKYVNVSAPVVGSDGKSPNSPAATSTRDMFAQALEGII